MKAVTLLLAVAAFGVQANHDEHDSHGHGAHEHGHGHLNLVLDGNQLMIELQAPAADLVGFEHAAKSDEEKAQYAQAVAQLKQPDALFRFDPAAGCKLTQQELQAAKEDHDHDHDHDHQKSDGKHDEHQHDDAGHADMGAMYTYTCATPAKLTGLEATLFSVYPSLEKLSVQGILPSGQTAAELTPSANKLSW
ncbi:DUF2796 domain-containing protein [Aeromonas hydrophila]|uniref:DUF2796 domain-containing protein n=1 Tax=Aeromonas hydrophila TaxID=644 RepID=UPI001B3A5982|nr:DUF2796 domain-containing protein [Aeromonas hydrophila]MBQ4678368.1 DUF2796 domain-containing protein [Aeromonas hydrophila]MBW3815708.1 DUF2796 domain-containing protein [Aeromonas hydrophila]MCF7679951.1 DUF2796 domain-containing protein [Aeromonas hydrophila]MCF7692806.1 DUF2796 domain-containing protein [Aeromonas hydrophila]MCF7775053.1 DUF2796 domain-containing protein [Aeromonas hydrophila]